MIFSPPLLSLAEDVLQRCRESGMKLATAESCTGGLVCGCLTAVAGSSDVMECGFVTYSDDAKARMLGVAADLFGKGKPGALSEQVARAMAEGALKHSTADISVSLTGIAGPGGGTAEKPVGLVHMASARSGLETIHERHQFGGDRGNVREQAVAAALRLILAQFV